MRDAKTFVEVVMKCRNEDRIKGAKRLQYIGLRQLTLISWNKRAWQSTAGLLLEPAQTELLLDRILRMLGASLAVLLCHTLDLFLPPIQN